jgi:hypothetical protein
MRAVFHFGREKDKQRLWQYLRKRKPIEYIVEVIEKPDARTLSQNAYYFGVVLKTLEDETGNHHQRLHSFFAKMFLKMVEVRMPTGEVEYVPQSTTELSVQEFGEYLEKIICYSLETLEIKIPEPNAYTNA